MNAIRPAGEGERIVGGWIILASHVIGTNGLIVAVCEKCIEHDHHFLARSFVEAIKEDLNVRLATIQ